MKISDLEVYVVDPSGGARTYNDQPENVWTFVRLVTDGGLEGWGEASNFPSKGSLMIGDALRRTREAIVGEDPADITRLWHRLYRRFTYLGSRGLPTALLSGIDIALWDLKGKALGRPVYDLIGGRVRERVPLYANGWFDGCTTPDQFAEAARRTVEQGFQALKCDPFLEMAPLHTAYLDGQISAAGEAAGLELVAAIREAIGPRVELLIDAHGHYNGPTAVRIARGLEPSRIGWLAEPVPPECLQALKAVRQQVRVPLCVGERLYTRWDFLPILEGRLADYLMPDVVWTGGISELLRIASLAEVYGVPISPHNAMGPLQLIASAHVMLAIPNAYRLEHHLWNRALYQRCIDRPIGFEGGDLVLSERSGLGFELDLELLRGSAAPGWDH
jgi:galactonate dehydratase